MSTESTSLVLFLCSKGAEGFLHSQHCCACFLSIFEFCNLVNIIRQRMFYFQFVCVDQVLTLREPKIVSHLIILVLFKTPFSSFVPCCICPSTQTTGTTILPVHLKTWMWNNNILMFFSSKLLQILLSTKSELVLVHVLARSSLVPKMSSHYIIYSFVCTLLL